MTTYKTGDPVVDDDGPALIANKNDSPIPITTPSERRRAAAAMHRHAGGDVDALRDVLAALGIDRDTTTACPGNADGYPCIQHKGHPGLHVAYDENHRVVREAWDVDLGRW